MSTYVTIPLTLSNDDEIELAVTATAGSYQATVNIRGNTYVYPVTVANSPDSITIKNVFQEDTTHTLMIYESNGDLLDDTIYQVVTNALATTQVKNLYIIEVETTDGMTEYSNGAIRKAASVEVFIEGSQMIATTISDPGSSTITFPYPVDSKQRLTIKVFR